MRHAFIALLFMPALAAAQGSLGTYEDRVAVEDVMARYAWTVDPSMPTATSPCSPKMPSSTRTETSAKDTTVDVFTD